MWSADNIFDDILVMQIVGEVLRQLTEEKCKFPMSCQIV